MKKILIFLGSMERGGAERVISIISDRYASKGWDVGIVMLLKNRCGYPLNPSVRLIDLSGNIDNRVLRIPFWLREIRALIRREKPDVVLSFVARINILVLLAARGLKQKIIISERNDPARDGRGIAVRVGVKLLYPKADRIVFQTKYAMRCFKGRIAQKGVVIPNPIRAAVPVSSEKQKKIVTAGRLMPQKNHKALIEAFAQVHERFPDRRLVIYGEGYLREALEKQIQSLGLEEFIFLPGNMPNIHACIADAELFVLSSDYEGFSNAMLEAMMMGLPVVSTDCAGSNEFIKDGENGLMVPVGNIDAMAKAMIKALGDGDLRERMGEQGATDCEQFRAERIIKKWSEVLGG